MERTLKISHIFLIAIALINLSVGGFAQESEENQSFGCPAGGCPLKAANSEEKPVGGCPSGGCPLKVANSEEKPAEGCPSGGCPLKTANYEEKPAGGCPSGGCPLKATNNEDDDTDSETHSNNNDKDDCEKEKYSLVECDDVYCRCFPLSISHTEGHWLDNRQGYTSIKWFWPFPAAVNCNCFPFADVRCHVLNDATTAGNFGGGIRLINACNGCTILGANIFYDFRKAAWNHYFQQFGIGFEVLNPCFDFRFNGYIPFGRHKAHSNTRCHSFRHRYLASSHRRKTVLTGFDASVGKWIVKDACGRFDYYATLGMYSYFTKNHHKNIVGGEVRLIANLIQYFSLELRGGYDRVNGAMAQGTLGVYIPLGVSPCHCYTNGYIYDNCYLRERLCQPLLRQEMVAFEKKGCHKRKCGCGGCH